MTGVEINMVVSDSIKARAFYEEIFGAVPVEVTAYAQGMNEAVFTIFGTRFHLLDENPEYQLFAPKEGEGRPVWVNLMVEDIKATFEKALRTGCTVVQPLTELPKMGVSNAIMSDPFGHIWLLHQLHHVVSFEDRLKVMEDAKNDGKG